MVNSLSTVTLENAGQPEQLSELIPLALAIDIGGSKMAVGLVNRRGDMLDREIARTDKDKNANDIFEILAVLIKRQFARA